MSQILRDLRTDIGDDVPAPVLPPGVSGPTVPVLDNGVARFDGTSGSVIEGSLATLDDAGNLSTPGSITAGTALITSGAFCFTPRIITVTGPASVLATDAVLMINKSLSEATTLTLSSGQKIGRVLIIKDLKGDANSNFTTILASGGETIDGILGVQMTQNYQSITFIYNGSGWSII